MENYFQIYQNDGHNVQDGFDYFSGDINIASLFEEVDSPFFIDSIEKANNLKLYKIFIKNDLILDADIGYGSENHLIKEYGEVHVLNFNM